MRKPGEEDEEEPPGGRALQRLHQFEQARGLKPTQLEVAADECSASDDEEADELIVDDGDAERAT